MGTIDDDEPDKILKHHLGFCLLGFILHTVMMMIMMIMVANPTKTTTLQELVIDSLKSNKLVHTQEEHMYCSRDSFQNSP